MKRSLFRLKLAASALVLAAGCTTPAPAPSPPSEPDPPKRVVGEVLKTNAEYGYVIVSFMVMPIPGRELKVYRGGRRIGEIRVTHRRRPPFAAATLLEGQPRPGDVVMP